MNKLWLLAKSNIRKTKSVSLTLSIMFVIAALLLNTGLLVTINYGSFFDELKSELDPADAYIMIPGAVHNDEVGKYIDDNEHIKEYFREDALILGADIFSKNKSKEESYAVLFLNMDYNRKFNHWKHVGKQNISQAEMPVYVPSVFKSVSGYELGDTITLKYNDAETREEKSLIFIVAGYNEDIFFSSTDTGLLGFYLPEETYNKVSSILDHKSHEENIYFMQLHDISSASKVEDGVRELLSINSASLMGGEISSMIVMIDIELIELSRTMMASMISMMMVMFAVIIVTVCLLVVRFRIVNSIEDDMMKIGSLKSVGYTSRQIMSSILAQFLLIGGIGSVLGILLSYSALPAVSLVFEQQSGLRWEQGFDGIISGAALVILLLIVMLVSLLAARNVNRLSPINALRGESLTRGFKKNRFPLDKSKGRLSFVLAIKSVLQNMKLSVTISVIVTAVTFAGAYGVIMYYNTSVDTKAFAEVPGMEITNVIAALNPENNNSQTVDDIRNMENVRKVTYLDEVKIRVDDMVVTSYIMDDYTEKETRLVYDGHYPESKNEIVLAGILAGRIDKKVGDSVTVIIGDNEEIFNIVGLSNGSQMGGLNTHLLKSDYERLNPDFRQQNLHVYLEKGTDSADFIIILENKFEKEVLLSAVNFDKGLEEGMASYQNIVAAMGIAMLVITLLVVTLVLYFVIGSSIIRRKRELGIQKAIGYTTLGLMNQLAVGFIIPVSLGAAIGSLLGAFCTNPMMSMAMQGAGIMKANFLINPLWVVAFGMGTIGFSYLLSILVTLRIRKISAYALVTE